MTVEEFLYEPAVEPRVDAAVEQAYDEWRDAQAEAAHAYGGWQACGGAARFALYRVAQDRADAAQDLLAQVVPAARLRRAHADLGAWPLCEGLGVVRAPAG